jgi:hypothetical protein
VVIDALILRGPALSYARMSLVFISYRREDSAGFAGRLHESLERRLGVGEVFRDVDALQPGQDFVDAINARLLNCRACLVLIGREWLDAKDNAGRRRLEQDDDYVRLEIAAALARPGVLVIPVLVEGMSMPTSLVLPESIRALSRRQAVSLRDETWDTDVDRLAAALRHEPRTGTAPPPLPSRRPLKWAALGLLVLVVAAILVAGLFDRVAERKGTTTIGTTGSGSGSGNSDATATARAFAIAIPRVSEVAYGDLIYTVLAGGVTPHGASSTLRLRVRFSNEGRYPANFWDAAFRLALGGDVLSPTSGLNEIVDGHSLQQGLVSFDVPSNNNRVVLRILGPNLTAEMPLDLTSTGAASTVDARDNSDALSHAIAARLVRDSVPLIMGKDIDLTLVSATARRFVNSLRIVAAVRMTNRGRYPALFSTETVRLLADGQATAPFKGPSDAVDSRAPSAADFVFDVPPSTRRLVLQTKGESVAEMPLDVPSSVR